MRIVPIEHTPCALKMEQGIGALLTPASEITYADAPAKTRECTNSDQNLSMAVELMKLAGWVSFGAPNLWL